MISLQKPSCLFTELGIDLDYVIHYSRRAARMGRSGTAYSLISTDEIPFLLDLYLFLGRDLRNRLVEGDDGIVIATRDNVNRKVCCLFILRKNTTTSN